MKKIKRNIKKCTIVNKRKFIFSISTLVIFICILSSAAVKSFATTDKKYDNNIEQIQINKGDTLWQIASKRVPENKDIRAFIEEIKKENDLKDSNIQEGQVIKVTIYK